MLINISVLIILDLFGEPNKSTNLFRLIDFSHFKFKLLIGGLTIIFSSRNQIDYPIKHFLNLYILIHLNSCI